MGDIAEAILDGIFDEQTGEFIDDDLSREGGPGYPRTMEKGHYNSINSKHKKSLKKKKRKLSKQDVGGEHLVGKFADFKDERVEIINYHHNHTKSGRYMIKVISTGRTARTFFRSLTNISKNQ